MTTTPIDRLALAERLEEIVSDYILWGKTTGSPKMMQQYREKAASVRASAAALRDAQREIEEARAALDEAYLFVRATGADKARKLRPEYALSIYRKAVAALPAPPAQRKEG